MQIHYTARFGDGIVFDSSYKRGRPLTMRIGVGKVDKFFVAVNFFWLYDFVEFVIVRVNDVFFSGN
jgi:hypothetical protein